MILHFFFDVPNPICPYHIVRGRNGLRERGREKKHKKRGRKVVVVWEKLAGGVLQKNSGGVHLD